MVRKRRSPESIAAVLRKAESGTPIAQLARQTGVRENTIHLWKKSYGQFGTAEIREMNELRDENTRWAPSTATEANCPGQTIDPYTGVNGFAGKTQFGDSCPVARSWA